MQADLDTRDDEERPETSVGGDDSSLPVPEETFGTWLMTAREQRNLSLDDVAHITKIRKAILEALERGAMDELPERVFVTGYVRSYASAVGVDAAEAVRRFNDTYPDDEMDEDPDGEVTGRGLGWIGPLVAAIVALLAAWFIITKL